MVTTVVALLAAELLLRVVWHNPFRHESPDRVVALRMQHANTNHSYKQGLPGQDESKIQFRSDDRSYILPSERHPDAVATVFFSAARPPNAWPCTRTNASRFWSRRF